MLGRQIVQIREMFAAPRDNARVIVLTEAFSAISLQWFSTYLPLYMLALGVSEMQVGLLASALFSMRFVSTLMGGYAADRLGRKRTLVIFDILCWGIPTLLYAIARNPWYFLVGQLLNGLVYVVLPSFECLFVEDVPVARRPGVFGSLAFLTAIARLLAPMAGLFVARMGMVIGGRIIMAVTCASIIAMAIVRQFTLRETSMGAERMAITSDLSATRLLSEYSEAIRGMFSDMPVRTFLLVRMLSAATLVIWGTYAAIYLTDERGLDLSEASIALFPFVAAIVTMAILLAAAGRMRVNRTFGNLIGGQAMGIIAAICFLLAPSGGFALAAVWAGLTAAGRAIFEPANASYWATIVGDRERAQVFAASAALLALATVPAGPIAGLLYTVDVRYPFVLALLLQLIILFLLFKLRSVIQQTEAVHG
jgi:MFS family permease